MTNDQLLYYIDQIIAEQNNIEAVTNEMREKYVIDTLNEGYDDWASETNDKNYQLSIVNDMLDKLEDRGAGHGVELIDDVVESFCNILAGHEKTDELDSLAENFRYWNI